MTDQTHHAFTLLAYRETLKVKPLALYPSIPMEEVVHCPACQSTSLTTLVVLVGSQNEKVQKGICTVCGTMTFLNRPTRAWIVNYYSSTWDEAEHGGSAADLHKFQRLGESRSAAVHSVESAGLAKDAHIFEVAVGYGGVLKNLFDQGYKNVMGIENSAHRARRVHDTYGFPIWHGEFGDTEVTESIRKAVGTIDCFFAHHVLEHVDSPDAFIAAAAALQTPGGKFVISVPDAVGEHACLAALYLPHLHNFTKEGLEKLLNRNGYEIEEDVSPNDENIIIRAVRTDTPKARFNVQTNYVGQAIAKFIRGFALKSIPQEGRGELYWEEGWGAYDTARIHPIHSHSIAESVRWQTLRALRSLKKAVLAAAPGLKKYRSIKNAARSVVPPRGYTMLVAPHDTRSTDVPLEIHFPGVIQLLVK